MAGRTQDAEAIDAVDAILAQGGLKHGRRSKARHTGGKTNGRVPGPELIGKSKSAGAQQTECGSELISELPSGVIRPGFVKISAWAGLSWLRAGFSTRQGGGSTAYGEADTGGQGEQNLGWTAEDSASVVAQNRSNLITAVAGTAEMELVTMRQFHSGMVRVVERGHGPLATPEGKAVLRGDGLMSREAGLLLGVQTADCVPILIADTRTRGVAGFHAGWRGTLARIVERGVGTMRLEFGSRPDDLVAAIGPAIGACCFAVGEEVKFDFESQFAYGSELFSEVYDSDPVRQKYPMLFLTARAPGHSNLGPQIHLNLWEANRRQLLDAGLSRKAISVIGQCTGCARLPDGRRKYFSHRAERGFTGRMLSLIGVARDASS